MSGNPANRVLIFDVWGDYAHFRRFYTTTSPLTFPIPPRTALCGLIGAILGMEKENNDYLNYFSLDQAHIGLRLLNPVKKVTISENLINTKDGYFIPVKKKNHAPRTRIRFEFIKNPKYRIYFHHNDEDIYRQMKENLKGHKSVYTPSLGLSENLANFKFVGDFDTKPLLSREYISINSTLPTEYILDNNIKYNSSGRYFTTRVPVELDTNRVVTKYSNIFFEMSGNPVEVKLTVPYRRVKIDGEKHENFVFIE